MRRGGECAGKKPILCGGDQDCRSCLSTSVIPWMGEIQKSHHLRNPGMIRFPGKYQQNNGFNHGFQAGQDFVHPQCWQTFPTTRSLPGKVSQVSHRWDLDPPFSQKPGSNLLHWAWGSWQDIEREREREREPPVSQN